MYPLPWWVKSCVCQLCEGVQTWGLLYAMERAFISALMLSLSASISAAASAASFSHSFRASIFLTISSVDIVVIPFDHYLEHRVGQRRKCIAPTIAGYFVRMSAAHLWLV